MDSLHYTLSAVIAIVGVLAHLSGRWMERRKHSDLINAYVKTIDGYQKTRDKHEDKIDELNDRCGHLSKCLSEEVDAHKETQEKLQASEHLRDGHARRVAELEQEKAGLENILSKEAERRKSVRHDPPHRTVSPRKVKR